MGSMPQASLKAHTPSEYQSLLKPLNGYPLMISGAMYAGDPAKPFATSCLSSRMGEALCARARSMSLRRVRPLAEKCFSILGGIGGVAAVFGSSVDEYWSGSNS